MPTAPSKSVRSLRSSSATSNASNTPLSSGNETMPSSNSEANDGTLPDTITLNSNSDLSDTDTPAPPKSIGVKRSASPDLFLSKSSKLSRLDDTSISLSKQESHQDLVTGHMKTHTPDVLVAASASNPTSSLEEQVNKTVPSKLNDPEQPKKILQTYVKASESTPRSALSAVESSLPSAPSVLDVEVQPQTLKAFYARLPWVPPVAFMVPYSTLSIEASDAVNVSLDLMPDCFSADTLKRLVQGLKFSRYKNVIDLSLAPASCLFKGGDNFAYVADLASPRKELAVLVATGVCVGSHLLQPIGTPGFQNKKILIKLFGQDYELFESRIGFHFRSSSFYGPVDSGTIAFQTKKENQIGSNSSRGSSSSPSKGSTSMFAARSPKKAALSAMASSFVVKDIVAKSFLDYQTEVPVYDGRPRVEQDYSGFAFTPSDWDTLASLPLYPEELPTDSLVTVGFTLAGPWNLSPDKPTAHFYINFVILLATPNA